MSVPHQTVRYSELPKAVLTGGHALFQLVSDAISHVKMKCLNAFLAAHQEIQCAFPNVTELNLHVLLTVHATKIVLRDVRVPPNRAKRFGSSRRLREVAVGGAPPLKKIMSKVEGEVFPFHTQRSETSVSY